jgi:hypothetical protein
MANRAHDSGATAQPGARIELGLAPADTVLIPEEAA